MTRPFIIYALPRSRTCWLSHLLTYGEWKCHHDPLAHMRPEGIAAYLKSPNVGIIDTGLVQYWRQMKGLVPDAKIFTIRRDVLDVRDSLVKIGLGYPISPFYQALEDIEKESGVTSIAYDTLNNPDETNQLLKDCTGHDDWDWCRGLADANIQINPEFIREKLCATS